MPAARNPPHELRFTHVASGARIAWARGVPAHAPSLVRVAHWMTHVDYDSRSPLFAPWLARLSRSLQFVRYDERGCGLSSADGTAPGLEPSLQELDAVVGAHGAARVALLGASAAAPVAVAYAVRHPERVSHLVLLGGFSHGVLQRDLQPESRDYFEAQVRLVELGWGRNDPAVLEFFSSRFLPAGPPGARAALNEQQRLSCDGRQAAALMRARAVLDVRELLAQVRVPTLVLHSEGDLVVPVTLGHELAAAIPGARFEALRSRNHLPVAPEPAFEQMCEAITTFVAAPDPQNTLAALTVRERELAALMAQGLDNLQLAAHLGVADKTVRNMLSLLYVKLGVAGRPQAIVRARDLGL